MKNQKFYRFSGLVLTILTVVTFVFALRAIPISGAFAPTEPIGYPYLNTGKQFPNDYVWMYCAIFMLLAYLVYMTNINIKYMHRISSRLSQIFVQFSAFTLITTYFLQAEVLPINIILEQNNGVSLFTQYNPFGIFIAAEVLGHLFLIFSLVLIAPLFNKSKIEKFLKGLLIVSFILAILIYIMLAVIYGLEKMERIEVSIICIAWLDLIVLGLVSFSNKREAKNVMEIDHEI